MNRNRWQKGILFLGLVLVCLGLVGLESGCRQQAEPVQHVDFKPAASLETNPDVLRSVEGIPQAVVESHVGHGGQPFSVKLRTPVITQFPCGSCHDQPLPERPEGEIEQRVMHMDIQLTHAASDVMNCRTCHNPEDLNTLKTAPGKKVDFDHVYQLCGQCHFQQVNDWAGGAHGKRLGGWRGNRVVMSCTECHDPHNPAIASEWPVARPIIPGRAGSRGH